MLEDIGRPNEARTDKLRAINEAETERLKREITGQSVELVRHAHLIRAAEDLIVFEVLTATAAILRAVGTTGADGMVHVTGEDVSTSCTFSRELLCSGFRSRRLRGEARRWLDEQPVHGR